MTPCGLLRRLAALFYDTLLVIAVLFIATIPWVALRGGAAVDPANRLYPVYLLCIVFAFFAGFWTRAGQTLGMKTWRIRLVREDGGRPSWPDAFVRFFGAWISALAGGAGFLWALWDRDSLTWHDRWSQTRLVVVTPHAKADP